MLALRPPPPHPPGGLGLDNGCYCVLLVGDQGPPAAGPTKPPPAPHPHLGLPYLAAPPPSRPAPQAAEHQEAYRWRNRSPQKAQSLPEPCGWGGWHVERGGGGIGQPLLNTYLLYTVHEFSEPSKTLLWVDAFPLLCR